MFQHSACQKSTFQLKGSEDVCFTTLVHISTHQNLSGHFVRLKHWKSKINIYIYTISSPTYQIQG